MYKLLCLCLVLFGVRCSNTDNGCNDDLAPCNVDMGSSTSDLATPWHEDNPASLAQVFRGVWGADANNVWVVGDAGVILRLVGTAWITQSTGTARSLHGVWGTGTGNVWAVGDAGTILKGDYEPSIRTYTDLRMEMSCERPTSPT